MWMLLLQVLPATKHHVETLDAQPVQENVINVLVSGKILVRSHTLCLLLLLNMMFHGWVSLCGCAVQLEGQTNPLMFAQFFHIVIEAAGPYVAGDMFRLNYG